MKKNDTENEKKITQKKKKKDFCILGAKMQKFPI
jgi:hypothetical protein